MKCNIKIELTVMNLARDNEVAQRQKTRQSDIEIANLIESRAINAPVMRELQSQFHNEIIISL